ncbi:MAG: hypothetical protein R2713_11280 [Ilumatobacteraceae bacterium]
MPWADAVPGLQIVGPDGAWHDVVPAPGALLVNLGDLTANGPTTAGARRCTAFFPPARRPDGAARRRSAAFFHDGNWDAVIECLPTCTGPGDPPLLHPFGRSTT